MKRYLLISTIVLGYLAGGSALPADQGSSDALQTWIAKNAAPVRSVDATDEDFRDLEPLAKAIGSAQVIQLGEPGHGAGTSFAAKVRLIKFLHQRMGFDVLVWESGMYDVELSQAGMRGSDAAVAAARRGIFRLWSDSEEVRPLFEYIKVSQTTTHPLDMAGFDLQVTADGSVERFASQLRAFIQALEQAGIRDEMTALADQALAARARLFSSKFESDADVASLDQAAQRLLDHLDTPPFREVHDAKSIAWMKLWIANMQADARLRHDAQHTSGPDAGRESRRDSRNFENLRWLIREGYPGRKFIIWAHNVHVMKAYYSSDFRTVHLAPQAGDMKTTGVFLTDWLGKQVYTIGMTAYQGKDALVTGGAATVIGPAPADSLEGRLHDLGHPFAFLDLRNKAMHAPISARMPKYDSGAVSDPGRVYDGIFYIDQMEAATKLR